MRPDLSAGAWFAARAARTPGRRALTAGGVARTYAEMQARVARLAGALASAGARDGARVGYLGANDPSAYELLLAATSTGAIFVPLNTRLAPAELATIVHDAGLHLLVAGPGCPVPADELEGLGVTRVLEAGPHAPPGRGLEEAMAASAAPAPRRARADDEVAVLVYTSGTSGRPKGAMLTHANLWWNNANAMHALDVLEDEVALVLAPIFHIAGINGLALRTWQKGGEVVLLERFDAGAVLELVEQRRVTTLFGVPTMLRAIADHPAFATCDLWSLRVVLGAGAPVPMDLLRRYEERGLPVNQCYGLTETAPMVTVLGAEFAREKAGSAGLPGLFCELRIDAPAGAGGVGPSAVGEILVRGPNVMKGYWGDPAATRAVIDEDGWLRTGDAGYLDEDGFLYVVDRVRDLIISGGENIYPAEVENVLQEHPAVREVVVAGEPDPYWGERVVAVVVPASPAVPSLEELRSFAGGRLARYKLPQRLVVVDELPRSGAGKVRRRDLPLEGADAPAAPRGAR